jgi:hypothetical protein
VTLPDEVIVRTPDESVRFLFGSDN